MISYVPPIDEAIGIFEDRGFGGILVDLHGADGVRLARVGEAMQKFRKERISDSDFRGSVFGSRERDKATQAEQGKANSQAGSALPPLLLDRLRLLLSRRRKLVT